MFKILIATLITTSVAHASVDKVIYGSDDRVLASSSTNELFKKLAKSTAAMIPASAVESKYQGLLMLIKGSSLKNSMGVCEDSRFADVTTSAMCSGFLVGDDLLVTAGHCIPNNEACANNKWVFDFKHELSTDDKNTFVDPKNVYGCAEVIHQELDQETMNDFALIKLDRKVVGTKPLDYRKTGKVEGGTEIVVIGHPSGLPSIIADGAQVRDNDNGVYFNANLDTFGGNSGSAVFNAETGVVEGILVRGERDYVYDFNNKCYKVNECANDECRGEDVTRITNIPELMTPAVVVADTVER